MRKYNKIQISKKELEVIKFLETGSNNFWDAYFNYKSRKKRLDRPTKTITSWFNSTIKSLHKKGLFKEVPFVLFTNNIYIWINPGINASKANFECLTLQENIQDMRIEVNKIIF